MFALCRALLGLLLFLSPLIDIWFERADSGPKRPEFRSASVYRDIIVDSQILPIHTSKSKIVPFIAVLDMLAVLHVLTAIVQSVLEGEPGNMSRLDIELDAHLPDP